MKVEIFIVSCAKHFSWLKYCIQSIGMFARGFSGVTLLIPRESEPQLPTEIDANLKGILPLTLRLGDEWPNRGMLWHMAQIMRAEEWCPDADFILHTDSDCLFTEPVSPEDYFIDGKPVLYYEKFESITRKHPEVGVWHLVTQSCLPFPVKYETMRRHPAVHRRNLYAEARRQIEIKTKQPVDEYIASCRNEYPQTFCEFITLGNVAIECFRPQYHLVDTAKFKNGFPPQKLSQCWSHSPPEIPQEPHYKGKPFRCTPDELLKVCAAAQA